MSTERLSAQTKRLVAVRATYCCEYCRSQARFSPQPFSVEHVIPRVKGGLNRLDNLALSCQGCNNHKYHKIESVDPITGKSVKLFHPRQQRWIDHFAWEQGYLQIIGVSPVGRATVAALRLNRIELVNLRRVLFLSGEHPPIT